MNALTTRQRANRACRRSCPGTGVPDHDGDAIRCPHGKWFVFALEHDSNPQGGPGDRSRQGRWRRARPLTEVPRLMLREARREP